MVTAISAIIVFLVLITIHEFGHFIAAKASGTKVYEFAIGMGPAILKWGKGETLYSLRILPIGGYCQLGEDSDNSEPGTFNSKPVWIRFIILFAGGFMNIVLGFLIFIILLSGVKQVAVPIVEQVIPGSAAEEAGILPNDRIISIDGAKVHTQAAVRYEIFRNKPDTSIKVEVERNSQTLYFQLIPKYDEESQGYLIGFQAKVADLNAFGIMEQAWYQTIFMSRVVITSLFDMITGKIGMNMVSGPVGIVNQIGSAAKEGFDSLLNLVALITVNLGVFNLLPFPALDGGRILFLLIELVRRKKIPPEKEGIVHLVGLGLLLLLMLFATWNDIVRLFMPKG